MRLSELLKPDSREIIGFLKFQSREEHLRSLEQGHMRMSNLGCYIEIEKNTGLKGLGDAWEATQVLNDVDLKLMIPGTEQVIAHVPARRVTMRTQGVENKPVFCLFCIDATMLEIIEETSDYYDCRIAFSEEQKQYIPAEFGDYVMLMNAHAFMTGVKLAFEQADYNYVAGFVEYSDFRVNYSDRIRSFVDGDESVFFWKDQSLSYQKEFRIVITNVDIENPLIVDIGPLLSAWIGRTDTLFGNELGIQVRKPYPKK